MKTLMVAAIRCFLMFLVPSVTYAISAQWDLDPISGDWNTAANWTPNEVPNGPADAATFGVSNTTNVSISEDTEVNGIIFTPAATNPYTITVTDFTLTISGVGITNNPGIHQNFVTGFGSGQIRFTNSSTADNVFIENNGLGSTNFFDSSTAGLSVIFNKGGSTNFFDRSTAGPSVIFNEGGPTNFYDSSTAGISEIFSGSTNFFDRSTAGNALFITFAFEPGGVVSFFDNSTAGSASITIEELGTVHFADTSTAGSATIVAAGGFISFEDSSQGGTARIQVESFPGGRLGSLDISAHNAPGVTIGSIEGGDGNVFLGANNLTIGSNNLSTTFSGVIQDGGQNGGTGGSLTKIGSGTLILSGANTYTGNTNINRGVLQVDGSITSNTFVNHGGTLAGTGTINGNLTNNGRVSPGSAGAPGMLTVTGNYTQTQYATLMIQIAGRNTGQFSVLNVMENANLNGFLDPVLLNGFVPTIGQTFTFLDYASLTGEFSHIKHQVFDNGMLQWSVIYEPNQAILTVEQHVPDPGSTLLLLGLSLLGLVTYRRQLMRGQT
jgi:autotransporter-associated beta strand protein